jgi:hypothetical protein
VHGCHFQFYAAQHSVQPMPLSGDKIGCILTGKFGSLYISIYLGGAADARALGGLSCTTE